MEGAAIHVSSLLADSIARIQEEAWVALQWLKPDLPNPKGKTALVEKLGTVELPYFGETPIETVVFVASAFGFRLYQIWRYYFTDVSEFDLDTKHLGGKRKPATWKYGTKPASSNNRRGSPSQFKPKHSKWWRRWLLFGSCDDNDSSIDAHLPLEPDAKATSWGTYKDPSLAAFINEAQQHKEKLRHVEDPLLQRRKKLQAIRTKSKATAQGPLGLSDTMLQNTRSKLRQTVFPSPPHM